jgi:hypothetical protein
MARVEIYESCNDTVAHLGGVRRTLKHTADKGAAVARACSWRTAPRGTHRITVTRGDRLDYFVNLDDTRGEHAAAAIEFGNRYGGGGIAALQRAFGIGRV